MNFTFLHLYPDLMNLYGSYANLSALTRALERLGHSVSVIAVQPYASADPELFSSSDFIYMGAGTERSMAAALTDARQYADALKSAKNAQIPMLFTGTAMELLGTSVTDRNGKELAGLALADYNTVQGDKRFVEDVIGFSPLLEDPIVGFMNKSSVTTDVTSPFLTRLRFGIGNQGALTPEGYLSDNLIATELTGPLLIKNPLLVQELVRRMYLRHGLNIPDHFPSEPYAEAGYKVTVTELTARSEK